MIYSSGIIPFRRNNNGELEFLLGHPGGNHGDKWNDYWAFLKGSVENGETWEATAIREFHEESGIDINNFKNKELIPLGIVQQNKRKCVIAFAMYYPNIDIDNCFSNIVDNEDYPEIDRYKWMTFDELKTKTHPTHINFYEQIIELAS